MSARTPKNCKYVKKFGPPNQWNGLCEGFQRTAVDDEPAALCMECKYNYFNENYAAAEAADNEEAAAQ